MIIDQRRYPGTPWTTLQVAELARLVQYLSIEACAIQFGVSKSRIYAVMKQNGILPPRKRLKRKY